MTGFKNSNNQYESKIIPITNDKECTGYIAYNHSLKQFMFEASVTPITGKIHNVGTVDNRFRNLFISNWIHSFDGSSGFELAHYVSDNSSRDSVMAISSIDSTGGVSAQIVLFNSNSVKYLNPSTDGDIGLGASDFRYRDLWSINGAIQTCDMNVKENIKTIDNIATVYSNMSNDDINSNDLYEYVKNINIYSYNYKNNTDSSKQIGVISQELKNTNDKVWEYLGISNEDELDAIKQGSMNGLLLSVIKTLIEKVEILESKL